MPIRVKKKEAETMPEAQHSLPGQATDQLCKACAGRTAWQIWAAIHRGISRPHSELHSRFSF